MSDNKINGTDLRPVPDSELAPPNEHGEVEERARATMAALGVGEQRARVARWTAFSVDVPLPPEGIHPFEVDLCAPAIYLRAFVLGTRTESKVAGQDGRPVAQVEHSIKLVFMVCPDAPKISTKFAVVTEGNCIGVRADNERPPQPLDVVLAPPGTLDAQRPMTVAIWQLTGFQEHEAAALPEPPTPARHLAEVGEATFGGGKS